MAQNLKQQVPSQWSGSSFAALPSPTKNIVQRYQPAAASTGAAAQPAKSMGAPQGSQPMRQVNAAAQGSFQHAGSFGFFKAPPLSQQPSSGTEFTFKPNPPGASLPSFPSVYSEAPLQNCPSYASNASNDMQEELHLHPNMKNLKKPAAFEADHTSILQSAMGSTLANDVPVAFERQMRQNNGTNMQRTESQLIQAHAQALALQEQRRRAQQEATAQKGPSPIRSLLAARRSPQKIYLMRHGESEANISRRDVPDPNLTHLGLAQAKSWQETIGDLAPDLVLVSPLRRAVQTACHAFQYEEVPMLLCRFAREIGWSANENTIYSTPVMLNKMLQKLPRGDEVYGVKEALTPGPDDPATEMDSLQRLKMVLAGRPESTIVVVCHFGVIAATSGCRAKNGDIYECDWGYNDELRVVARHKTPLADSPCICG
jgi:broad specificity phosphatase PhoE